MIPLLTKCKALVHYKHFQQSLRKVSAMYKVSKSSLHRWVQKDPEAKLLQKQRINRRRRSALGAVSAAIRRIVEANPFTTMAQLAVKLREECGISRSRATVGRYRSACGLSFKKAFRTVAPRNDPVALQAFCNAHLGCTESLVCIDEAGF